MPAMYVKSVLTQLVVVIAGMDLSPGSGDAQPKPRGKRLIERGGANDLKTKFLYRGGCCSVSRRKATLPEVLDVEL